MAFAERGVQGVRDRFLGNAGTESFICPEFCGFCHEGK